MADSFDFFFDYISPTAYIASAIAPGIATRTGASMNLRPMFLGGVMKATGNQPPGTLPARGKYMSRDLQRCCERYDLPLHFNQHFPMLNTRPLTGATIRLADQPEEQMRLFNAAWKIVWGAPNAPDIGKEDEFVSALNDAGFDGAALWALGTEQETKAMLRANTEEAVTRGAFGAPTFFVGDEMFFGHDRLDYVERILS